MTDEDSDEFTRRTFVKTSGLVAGAGLLGLPTATAASTDDAFDRAFANPRVWELSRVWEKGYRGRPDRSVGVGDTGCDARHPDLSWNNVRIVEEDEGGLGLTKVETGGGGGIETVGEVGPFSGIIGPGVKDANAAARQSHDLDVPDVDGDLEVVLDITWEPQRQDNEGLLLDKEGKVKASSTDFNPLTGAGERVIAPVEPGDQAAIETYANAAAQYEISGRFIERDIEISEVDEGFDPMPAPDASGTDVPKLVGWNGSTLPRDGNGHGTHVSSISAGSGQGSAVDPESVVQEEPRTVLAPGEVLEYVVTPESGKADSDDEGGVYVSVFGDNVDVRIEDPDGRTVKSTSVTDESSLRNDVTVVATHAAKEGDYTVYVESGTAVTGTSTARVERVSVGALLPPSETAGARDGGSTIHAGVAPDSSLVTSQGLSNTLEKMSSYPDFFTGTFGLRTVNFSFGGLPTERLGLSDTYQFIEDIAKGGILTVSSAGNNGPLTGSTGPSGASEAIAVAATGPLDGLTWYTSGGTAVRDEDGETYRKPDVTAPGGKYFDAVDAAEAGEPLGNGPVREYTDKAGTSMAAPYVNGVAGLVAEAMEFDAPDSIALPAPEGTEYEDVLRLKQVLLATASETAFTAAPYHRAHAPTYEFGGRDSFEGFGRVNPDAAVDAVSRELAPGTTVSESVGLNRHEDARAVAGYVTGDPGVYEVSVDFSYLSGGNKGMAKGNPHIDLFVYDAEAPADNGEPNVVAKAQGLEGDATVQFTASKEAGDGIEAGTYLVVAKLVNVPGVVNGYDVQAHFDLSVEQVQDTIVAGTRTDDGTAFTGGQTDHVEIEVTADEPVIVRDAVPADWELYEDAGSPVRRTPGDQDDTNRYYVYYDPTGDDATTGDDARESASFDYFVNVPEGSVDGSDSYEFGPVEVSHDGGDTWIAVPGTADRNYAVAQRQP